MVSQFPLSSDFVLLRDAMNQLLSDSFVPSGGARSGGAAALAAMGPVPLDVYATPDEAVVIAAVPGMTPENLEITYTQNTLTLSGSVPHVAESEQGQQATWYLRELWSGQFQRTVTLPFEVDASRRGHVRTRHRAHHVAEGGVDETAEDCHQEREWPAGGHWGGSQLVPTPSDAARQQRTSLASSCRIGDGVAEALSAAPFQPSGRESLRGGDVWTRSCPTSWCSSRWPRSGSAAALPGRLGRPLRGP